MNKNKNKDTANVEVNIGNNFIHDIIDKHLEEGVYDRVHTRFPPEPNGYLHIGHAKSICLNFGTAAKYNGLCNLRFDDTNPEKEEIEYIESIKEDIKWLGFDWEDRLYFASDYFDKMYEYAVLLIKKGKAYVDDLSPEEIREYRGTLTEPGKNSPYRDRSIEENLELFERMKAGEFEEGSKVLRAKIDMASPNMNMRDPVLYRICYTPHHRTGDKWCIYPMYDYAHPISDALENITHSLCTLEFEDHRPLYEWVLREIGLFPNPPVQIEFARLELTNTVMSKRKLRALVEEGKVDGWDDPRMPTLSGLRRRGYTPSSIRDFAERVGIAKTNSVVDVALLEHCVREELNQTAPRVMGVIDPLKLVITNYPEDKIEYVEVENNPQDPTAGTRQVPFSRVLYIEKEDFMENPPRKFFRLSPGKEVRLRNAYIIRCDDVVKDPETGEVIEVHCTYDPDTKSGTGTANRKVKGTLHWVSAQHAVPATIRLYDYLFLENEEGEMEYNPDSIKVMQGYVEPSLKGVEAGKRFQFIRKGYFFTDIKDSTPDNLVFNEIVSLKSSYKPNK